MTDDRPLVVLVHGVIGNGCQLAGRADVAKYWSDVPGALRDAGFDVLVPDLPHKGSVRDRASSLTSFLGPYGDRGPHLLAHSMGGLDSRYALTILGMPARSLTTVGTPPWGSPLAELSAAAGGLAVFVGGLFPAHQWLSDAAVHALTPSACALVNAAVKDVPGVDYYAVAGVHEPDDGLLWTLPTRLVGAREGPNDGLVSERSARPEWWPGETWPDVSHAGELGWPVPFGDGNSRASEWVRLAKRALVATTS